MTHTVYKVTHEYSDELIPTRPVGAVAEMYLRTMDPAPSPNYEFHGTMDPRVKPLSGAPTYLATIADPKTEWADSEHKSLMEQNQAELHAKYAMPSAPLYSGMNTTMTSDTMNYESIAAHQEAHWASQHAEPSQAMHAAPVQRFSPSYRSGSMAVCQGPSLQYKPSERAGNPGMPMRGNSDLNPSVMTSSTSQHLLLAASAAPLIQGPPKGSYSHSIPAPVGASTGQHRTPSSSPPSHVLAAPAGNFAPYTHYSHYQRNSEHQGGNNNTNTHFPAAGPSSGYLVPLSTAPQLAPHSIPAGPIPAPAGPPNYGSVNPTLVTPHPPVAGFPISSPPGNSTYHGFVTSATSFLAEKVATGAAIAVDFFSGTDYSSDVNLEKSKRANNHGDTKVKKGQGTSDTAKLSASSSTTGGNYPAVYSTPEHDYHLLKLPLIPPRWDIKSFNPERWTKRFNHISGLASSFSSSSSHKVDFKIQKARLSVMRIHILENTIEACLKMKYPTSKESVALFRRMLESTTQLSSVTMSFDELRTYSAKMEIEEMPRPLREELPNKRSRAEGENSDFEVFVFQGDSLEIAYLCRIYGFKPCVLNMGNNKTRGGGYLYGAGAQEESLFRRTNLFHRLGDQETWRRIQKRFPKQGDALGEPVTPLRTTQPLNFADTVFTSKAVVFREPESQGYAWSPKPWYVDVVTACALNVKHFGWNEDLAYKIIVALILRTWIEGNDCLVLGTLGCGAFKNDPATVARLFRRALYEEGMARLFNLVVFAIIDDHNSKGNLDIFGTTFSFGGKDAERKIKELSQLRLSPPYLQPPP